MNEKLIARARRIIEASEQERNRYGAASAFPKSGVVEALEELTDALEAAPPVVALSEVDLDAIEQRVTAALAPRTVEAPAYTVAPAAEALTARAAVSDAAKLPEAWSTEDRQESKQEAERRWSRPVEREAEQRYQSGCINGFMLGAEWQKARETFISYKVIADEARSERDAALAAVERVRAAVDGPHPANSGLDSFTLAHISAALDGAPEPEWEYVGMAFEHGGFMRIRNDQLVPEKFESWRKLMAQYPRVEILKRVKAVPAGPWLPVEGESKS